MRAAPHRRCRNSRRSLFSAIEALEPRQLLSDFPIESLDQQNQPLLSPEEAIALADLSPEQVIVAREGDDIETPISAASFDTATWTTNAAGLPLLNSRAGAPTAIYIDFDGYGTNLSYSEDADGATFNTTEQANIFECWRHIAVYYAMFNANVTTVLPSVPMTYNIVSNSISGGYAYVGTFPTSTAQGYNESSNARSRQSGIAHEIGHVYGLSHQSDYDLLANKTAEYSSGFSDLRGPLMGVDYAKTIHKFTYGHPSSSPSTLQDDVTYIANRIKAQPGGGDGFAPDDFANTIATSPALNVSGQVQSEWAIIERMTDVDAFSFASDGSPLVIAANRDWPGGADLKLGIYDVSGTLLALADNDVNDQQVTLTLPAGTYYALVSSAGNYADLGAYEISVRPMLAGFSTQDIGVTMIPGYAGYDSATGTFSLGGSGDDIWGTSDEFRFAYTTLTGDGEILARVTAVENTSGWAKAGVMIRETLNGDSKHAMMVVTPSNGTAFQYRSSTGGSSGNSNTGGFAAPYWVKLVRSGNTLTGYRSSNGTNWTQQSSTTISMTSTVYIGLAIGAGNNDNLNDTTFTNVSLSGNIGAIPAANGLPAPLGLTLSVGTGTGINLAWTDGEGETGYVIERSADGAAWTVVTTTAADVTSYSDNNLSGSRRYFYRISAADAAGRSPASTVQSIVNRPSAPTNVEVTSWTTSSLIIDWRDTDEETGYRIERSTDGTTWTVLGTVGANVPSYTNTGLSTATQYRYRVIPLSATGDGPASTVAIGSTRLPALTGLAFTNKAYNQMAMSWTAVTGATSYRVERSTDGTSFSTLSTVTTLTYADNTVSAMNEYYYRVVGINSLTEGTSSTIFAATPQQAALPLPWSSQDIGTVGGTGASGFASNTFTVLASGSDIEGGNDHFRYTYMPLNGDGEMVVRVVSLENTDAAAQAGIMIRESFNTNSRNAFMALTSENGLVFQRRTSNGGQTAMTTLAGIAAPYYLKLSRSANTFAGSYSADGAAWTQLGSVTINMGTSAYIGLAVTSHDNALLAKATFNSLTYSNIAPTVQAAAAASPTTTTSATNLTVLGADDHGEANLIYTWAATSKPSGAADPVVSANGSNAAKASTATFSKAGAYTLRVTITDVGGLSITSSINVTVSQTLTSIIVSPASVTLLGSQQQQFAASARDQFGDALTNQPAITWSLASGVGTINSTGLYTGSAAGGSAVINARNGSVTGVANVTITAPASVSGKVYQDNDSNGAFEATDEALAGWTVFVDSNSNSTLDAGEPSAVTGAAGDYTISNVTPATATLRVVNPGGFAPLAPAAISITPAPGQSVTGKDFTFFDMSLAGSAEADVITLARSGSNGTITITGPGGTRSYSASIGLVPSVAIDADGGSDRFVLDFTGGNPFANSGLSLIGGGQNDTLEIAGVPASPVVSIGTSSLNVGTLNVSLAGLFSIVSASGRAAFTGGTWMLTMPADSISLALAGNSHVAFTAPPVLDSLTLSGSGRLDLGGSTTPLVTGTLFIADLGTIDVADSSMIVQPPPASTLSMLNQLRALALSGRGTGSWDGHGLLTSSATANTSLAVMLNRHDDGSPRFPTFGGVSVDADSILLRQAYSGDTDLDDSVNIDDYFRIDVGFARNTPGTWLDGDFDYDGAADGDDYFLIDLAFLTQSGPLSAARPQPLFAAQPIPSLPELADDSIFTGSGSVLG